MSLSVTLMFYMLIGGAVAVAVLASADDSSRSQRGFRMATGLLFWPLYLPLLLRPPAAVRRPSGPPEPAQDEMAAAIGQVESELDAALQSLDGWAEDVLSRECERFGELRAAWNLQAARIRELDVLLAQPEFVGAASGGDADSERVAQSRRNRQENVARLQRLRTQMHDDLMGTLAWVRELVTMIHLAKYTGAPASRAEELVGQIAAAVEGLSEVTAWRDESLLAVG